MYYDDVRKAMTKEGLEGKYWHVGHACPAGYRNRSDNSNYGWNLFAQPAKENQRGGCKNGLMSCSEIEYYGRTGIPCNPNDEDGVAVGCLTATDEPCVDWVKNQDITECFNPKAVSDYFDTIGHKEKSGDSMTVWIIPLAWSTLVVLVIVLIYLNKKKLRKIKRKIRKWWRPPDDSSPPQAGKSANVSETPSEVVNKMHTTSYRRGNSNEEVELTASKKNPPKSVSFY